MILIFFNMTIEHYWVKKKSSEAWSLYTLTEQRRREDMQISWQQSWVSRPGPRAHEGGLYPPYPVRVRENNEVDNCRKEDANPWTVGIPCFSFIWNSLLFPRPSVINLINLLVWWLHQNLTTQIFWRTILRDFQRKQYGPSCQYYPCLRKNLMHITWKFNCHHPASLEKSAP